jgi:hypothetical protein
VQLDADCTAALQDFKKNILSSLFFSPILLDCQEDDGGDIIPSHHLIHLDSAFQYHHYRYCFYHFIPHLLLYFSSVYSISDSISGVEVLCPQTSELHVYVLTSHYFSFSLVLYFLSVLQRKCKIIPNLNFTLLFIFSVHSWRVPLKQHRLFILSSTVVTGENKRKYT